MQTLKQLFYILTPQERKRGILLLLMILIMALLDVVGVASILPFIAVLTNPNLVETNVILKTTFEFSRIFGVENNDQFLFALGILVFGILIASLAFKAFTTYVQIRFVQMREYSISKRLIEGYLKQPYSWFLNRHSADLGKSILSEVSNVVGRGLRPMMDLIARCAVAITLISLLFLTDPKLTLIIFFILGGTYAIIYKFTRTYLGRIGKESLKANKLRFTAVSEAFGASKEVKVGGLEKIYVNQFSKPAETFAQTSGFFGNYWTVTSLHFRSYSIWWYDISYTLSYVSN